MKEIFEAEKTSGPLFGLTQAELDALHEAGIPGFKDIDGFTMEYMGLVLDDKQAFEMERYWQRAHISDEELAERVRRDKTSLEFHIQTSIKNGASPEAAQQQAKSMMAQTKEMLPETQLKRFWSAYIGHLDYQLYQGYDVIPVLGDRVPDLRYINNLMDQDDELEDHTKSVMRDAIENPAGQVHHIDGNVTIIERHKDINT